jgi:hypothetical protein
MKCSAMCSSVLSQRTNLHTLRDVVTPTDALRLALQRNHSIIRCDGFHDHHLSDVLHFNQVSHIMASSIPE